MSKQRFRVYGIGVKKRIASLAMGLQHRFHNNEVVMEEFLRR
jgi:hypothetical protein